MNQPQQFWDPATTLTTLGIFTRTRTKTQTGRQKADLELDTPTSAPGGTTKYEYYAGGRLKTEDGPWSSDTVTNLYNSAGLRTNLVLLPREIETRLSQPKGRCRELIGRAPEVRTALSHGARPTGTWTNGFVYDAAKRLTSVASKAGSFAYTYLALRALLPAKLSLPNTSYITNDYDSVARLLFTKLNNSSHTTLNKHEYLYNAGNQRTQQVFNAGSTYGYAYDAIGQLKIADSATASEDRGYVYDAAWNLNYRTNNTTPTTFTVNNRNELTNVGGQGFSYDGNGNLTNYVAAYTTVATYDAENQLATIEETYNRRSVFTYDGRGRLRQRQDYLWVGTPYFYWSEDVTVRYVYDGMRVIQERNSGNTPTVSYTRGNDLSGSLEGAGGIGGLLARSHGYSGGNWSTHNFYHADGGGNVTYLVNSSQTLAASYRYDPYGNTISSSGTLASANVYRFSSKEIIQTGNLYYYGYRFYDPNLQRWLNRDPLATLAIVKNAYGAGFARSPKRIDTRAVLPFEKWVGSNLYQYVHNNPINKFDPLGLWTFGIGLTINFQIGIININFSSGFVVDGEGGFGGYLTPGGGVGLGAHASGGVSVTGSNAETICDLREWFSNASVGAGAGIDGSVEVYGGNSSNGPVFGGGFTLGAGLGAGGAGGGSHTWILPFGDLW